MLSFIIICFILYLFTIATTATTITENRVTGYESRGNLSSARSRAATAPDTFQATSRRTAGKRRYLRLANIPAALAISPAQYPQRNAIYATKQTTQTQCNISGTMQRSLNDITVTICAICSTLHISVINWLCSRFRCKLTA